MSGCELRDYVDDMVQACEDIVGEVVGIDIVAFAADRRRQKIVIRDLEVLGEASRKIPGPVRTRFPGVAWEQIVAMRNKLIHEYFGVDATIVFTTATEDVPRLLAELRTLQQELERGEDPT